MTTRYSDANPSPDDAIPPAGHTRCILKSTSTWIEIRRQPGPMRFVVEAGIESFGDPLRADVSAFPQIPTPCPQRSCSMLRIAIAIRPPNQKKARRRPLDLAAAPA
jgi:hypothetical protein